MVIKPKTNVSIVMEHCNGGGGCGGKKEFYWPVNDIIQG